VAARDKNGEAGGLLICRNAALWDVDGLQFLAVPGTIVRADNPAIKGREQFFERLILELWAEPTEVPLSQTPVLVVSSDVDLGHGKERSQIVTHRTCPAQLAEGGQFNVPPAEGGSFGQPASAPTPAFGPAG
jgi:hypothetical protein